LKAAAMSPEDFSFLSEFLRRRSGLLLTSHKVHLVEFHLAPVARRFGFRDVGSLLRELRIARETLAGAVTEAMTTNDSSFFRDREVFDLLRESALPKLLKARATTKRLRIWSSACAAGQEAYSVAMILDDLKLTQAGWSIDLIATDLNSDLIARAEEGVYTQYEVQRGLEASHLEKHFTRDGESWRINDSLRRLVTFKTFNLLDSFGWLYPLDLVLCRNVLIYFDQGAKIQTIDKIADVLSPDGQLVVGQTESVSALNDAFVRVGGSCAIFEIENEGAARHPPLAAIA
jgi:chemotaxis protein methyltransferase CheR